MVNAKSNTMNILSFRILTTVGWQGEYFHNIFFNTHNIEVYIILILYVQNFNQLI